MSVLDLEAGREVIVRRCTHCHGEIPNGWPVSYRTDPETGVTLFAHRMTFMCRMVDAETSETKPERAAQN